MKHRRLLWFALPVAALTALWAGRQPLTAAGVRQYLESKGVPARFDIVALSARRVVLQDVSLGQAGDSTARRLIIDYALGLRPQVARITLEGARLKARVHADGTYDLGALQPLVPPPSDEPLRLPDFDLRLEDARLQVSTPAGPIRLTINGQGNLAKVFQATVAGDTARLQLDGARADSVFLNADATLRNGLLMIRAQAASTTLSVPMARQARQAALAFHGTVRLKDAELAGAWAARVAAARLPGVAVEILRAKGLATFSPATTTAWARVQAAAVQARPDEQSIRRLRVLWSGLPASPLDPLKFGLSRTLDVLAAGTDAQADATVTWRGDSGAVGLRAVRLGSLATADSTDLRIALSSLHTTGSIAFRLTPAGLPALSGRAQGIAFQPGRPPSGDLMLNPVQWRAKDLDVALDRTAVSLAPGGMQVTTRLTASLQHQGIRIDALRVPVALAFDADGAVRLPTGCQSLSVARLRVQSLDIGPANTRLCAVQGPLLSVSPRGAVRGAATLTLAPLPIRQAETRLDLAPSRIALALSGSLQDPVVALEARALRAALEVGPHAVSMKAEALGLHWTSRAATLSLAGGAAELAGQPVALSGVAFAASLGPGGDVQVRNATALLRNTAARPAFAAIRLSGGRADLRGAALQGDGALLLNAKAQRIGSFRFAHDLAAAEGSAHIGIDGLTFSPDLEAYELTELARGQVENVSGTVAAQADLAWGQGIAAKGMIAFRNLGVATAALGPIEGINGTIVLDDLLAPHSPPDQTVTIDKINPGVAVAHGVLRFQLLPDFHLRVQEARWPFAGGDLFLEPMVIDPAADIQRMTFRAANMDAALLLQQFDLKNLRVTGRLDGAFPIVAEGTALRVENGRITTQPGGGLIQYVGEIGKEVTGPSKLAFDALQRFRYDSAVLELNGDLAGEIVAGIRFSGENQAPVSPAAGLPIRADGLPFKFNVTVRAPFRGLLNTASGLFDARKVIEQARPINTDDIPGTAPPGAGTDEQK